MTSDADLVRQARAGRTAAYEELVRRWAGRITALCHSRVKRAHLADELAQETLLRGFRALGSLTDPERFGPWPDEFLHSRERSVESDHERDEERRQIMAEVEALPEEYRTVVLLYYYQDLTYRDLAKLLGVSSATVNARLTKARSLLRTRLTHCWR
jgi:RNA polymerase sigma-70 factor (ECF subfamily)